MDLTEQEELEYLRLKEKEGTSSVSTPPTLASKAASFVNEINPLRLIKNQDIESLLLTLGGIGQPAEVIGETVKKAVTPGLSQLIASGVESVPKPPITPDEVIKSLISPETLTLPIRPLIKGFEAKTTPVTDKVAESFAGQLKPSEIITNLAATGALEGAASAVKALPGAANILKAASTTRLPAEMQMGIESALEPSAAVLKETPQIAAAIPGIIEDTVATGNLADSFKKSFSLRFSNFLKKNPPVDWTTPPKVNKETVAITPDDLTFSKSAGISNAITLDEAFAQAFKDKAKLMGEKMQTTDKINKLLELGIKKVEDFPQLVQEGYTNADLKEVMENLRQSSTEHGRGLQRLKRLDDVITPEENALVDSINTMSQPALLQGWNFVNKQIKNAVDAFRVTLTQTPATLIRNATTTFLEYPIKTLFDGVNGALETIGGKPAAESFAPFIQKFGAVYRAFSPTSRKAFQQFLASQPEISSQVHNLADFNNQNGFMKAIGYFGRMSEFKTRDLILDAKLSGEVGRELGFSPKEFSNWSTI